MKNKVWLWITGIIFFISIIQLARMTSIFPGCFPIDDSYIISVYAKNILDGQFFSYNSGVLSTGLTRNPQQAPRFIYGEE